MDRKVRDCPTVRSQEEGVQESERDPQQEDQQDATEGKDMADYDPHVDYEGSEPKVEQSAQEQKEVDPDAEFAEIEISLDGTLCQRKMPWEEYKGILQVHRAQGPEITASKFQNTYVQLGFSPKAAKLLFREQGLDNSDRLRVLINKNVDDICNVMRKSGGKNADGTRNRGQQVSVIAQENLKLTAFLFHHW